MKKTKTIKKQTSTIKTTGDKLIESLTPKEKKEFEEGYHRFALSELILALMEQDEISIRKLAKLANVSPFIIQALRSGTKKDLTMQNFFKILQGLGCNKFIIEVDGQIFPLELAHH